MTIRVRVELGGPTPYADLPDIPARLARRFDIYTFDQGEAGGEIRLDGPAPDGADDVVSECIQKYGVWEVAETILVLDYLNDHPGSNFLDVGCQIGWFSILAGTTGANVWAIDGNRHALELLHASWEANGRFKPLTQRAELIKPGWDPGGLPNFLHVVKIDVEGAEKHVIAGLHDRIANQSIQRILMEVSPVFNKSYPELLWFIARSGYDVWTVPEKSATPPSADDDLWFISRSDYLSNMTKKELTAYVNERHQFNIWCCA